MATRLAVTPIKKEDLQLSTLPQETQRAFLDISNKHILTDTAWYLAGGTALALQVGHRRSVDLDFFLPKKNFSIELLERRLVTTQQWTTSLREEGTLYGEYVGAKVSYIAYPFFKPSSQRLKYGAVCMLLPADIASMKIIAISQRGRKRDFIDLYWYCCNCEKLKNVVARALQQYPGEENNVNHILRSLVYFKDAEEDPMPMLYFSTSWKEVKSFFRKEVPWIARQMFYI